MKPSAAVISQIRQFNRYYTIQLGLLQQHIFDSEYSLTDVRVIYEIYFNSQTTATGIRDALQIDAGYLSRILRKLEKQGLVLKHPLPEDGRSNYLQLTARGTKLMEGMNALSDQQIAQMLDDIVPEQAQKIADAMRTVRFLLKAPNGKPQPEEIVIRHELKPGDLGDMIRLHGEIYAKEYGYDIAFEKYVMETLLEFMPGYDPAKDRIWLASCFGELIGMVAIIHRPEKTAQLRWFLLRPEYRGLGLGKRLMDEAMAFCKQQKFKHIYLLTTNQQATAAGLYIRYGFEKTSSVPATIWGQDLYEERYDRKGVYK